MVDVRRALALIVSIAILAMLAAGCTTAPGIFNGLADDRMTQLVIYRTDDTAPTKEQYVAIQKIAKKMGARIDGQLSSTAEAILSSAVPYAAAGAGGGATQGLYFPGLTVPGTVITATVYGLGGGVNGAVTASYANVYALGKAVEDTLRDEERDGKKLFRRLHVVAAFIRSRNNQDDPAPKLAQQMNWHGPVSSGSPAQR